jgi:acyl-CoA reductase-like NAD-dependent aldehyde dehydrogenase
LHAAHHNWIDGTRVPALNEDEFEVRIDGSRATIGKWPRSAAPDLAAAVSAAERAQSAWSCLGAEGRSDYLSDAIDVLLDDPDPDNLTGRTLGLSPREIDVHVEPLEWGPDEVLDGDDRSFASVAGSGRAGPMIFACEWSEMWSQPARTLVAALLAGRTVVLLSDARAPMLADSFAAALRGLPAGCVNVLHDDGLTLLRAAASDARVGSIHVPSTSAAAGELEARVGTLPTVVVERGFGAGIERVVAPTVAVRRVANASFVVRADVDLEDQARELVARSFSRAWALSGARPGRAGRAICPVRVFSRFSEHVLDVLATDRDTKHPLGIVRALLTAEVERVSRLGHDEGATAVFTGATESELGFPLVFTNVEERMRLAQIERPVPVLCLMRARDDAHARDVAARLDAHEIVV